MNNLEIYTENGIDYRRVGGRNVMINPHQYPVEKVIAATAEYFEINGSFSRLPKSLHFLTNLKGKKVKGLNILDGTIDYKLPELFPELEELEIPFKLNYKLDLSEFRNLKKIVFVQSKDILGLESVTTLTNIHVWNYQYNSIDKIASNSLLQDLIIVKGKLVSLDGINKLINLKNLNLSLCKKLSNIEQISQCTNIKNIDFEKCPELSTIEPLKELEGLETLRIHDCGEIRSLSSLIDLKKLRLIYITGKTVILDNDMTPLLKREDSLITPRKGYSHSQNEIDKINGTVRPKQDWEW